MGEKERHTDTSPDSTHELLTGLKRKKQVVTVLTHLKREDAVALLQRNHNSAEDAIMSALA
jgi:hypothetical protein